MSDEVVDAEVVEETSAPPKDLHVAVIGPDSALTAATARAFAVPRGVQVETFTSEPEDIDACVEFAPNIVFWCEDIPVKKNDSQNDTDLLAGIQKLIRQTGAGICIRTSITIETFERVIMSLTKDVFDNKIIYMPDMSDSLNIVDILSSDVQVVGGSEDALRSHLGVMQNLSWFSTRKLITCTIPEAIYTKLAVSGYRMVNQKFFNELHDAVMDVKNANPMAVNKHVQRVLDVDIVPSFTSCYDEIDARIFAGATDKLTLIESCLGD